MRDIDPDELPDRLRAADKALCEGDNTHGTNTFTKAQGQAAIAALLKKGQWPEE